MDAKAVVILGASGRGKSSLALQLLSLGAVLIADDRTCLSLAKDHVIASAPSSIHGQIEARGVGILIAPTMNSAPVHLVVDLETSEQDRLPGKHTHSLLGQPVRCFHNPETPTFAAAVSLYLRYGERVND